MASGPEARRATGSTRLRRGLAARRVAVGHAVRQELLARRALAPVDAMVDAARRIEAEDLTKRIPSHSSDDELGRLATVLNDMLKRLERAFGAARRFSADAAHELRTPLTIIKGEIEVALGSCDAPPEIRRTLASCLEEVDRMNSMVEDLLLLARMESNALSTAPAPVNLAEVLDDAAPALRELAAKAGNSCVIAAAAPLWIAGYEALLFRLVFNLVENAIKYSAAKGAGAAVGAAPAPASSPPPEIGIALSRVGDAIEIAVADRGPGVAAEDRERALKRFVRLEKSRSRPGAGLGLSLVAAVARMHGGTVRLEDNAPGLRAVLAIPMRRSGIAPPYRAETLQFAQP